MSRIMGVDLGAARVGVAISDESETLASGHSFLPFKGYEDLVGKLIEIALKEQVSTFVIGLPLNMDGSEGRQAAKANKLANILRARSGQSVILEDERLSTVEAIDQLHASGKKASKGKVDIVAAAVILQAFLDEQKKG
jgi:putative holliday junction resolvase